MVLRTLLGRLHLGPGIVVGILLVATARAQAHVEYVAENPGESVDPARFLSTVLTDPASVLLLGTGGAVAVASLVGYLYVYQTAPRDIAALREELTEFSEFLPWLLRLSIGLPLVGAGFSGYFMSPIGPVPESPLLMLVTRLFLVGVGFTLVFGILTRIMAAVGLLSYLLVAVFSTPELVLAIEFVGGFLAIVLVGSGRPSADTLLFRLASTEDTVYGGIAFTGRLTERAEQLLGPYQPYTPTVLRVGAGLSFLIVGLADKLLQPGKALVVVEQYQLTSVLPIDAGLWVVGAGGTEVVLGLALIVGFFTRGVATAAFGILTLTLFALPDDPVLAHIPLFGLAAALLITGSGRLALDNV